MSMHIIYSEIERSILYINIYTCTRVCEYARESVWKYVRAVYTDAISVSNEVMR